MDSSNHKNGASHPPSFIDPNIDPNLSDAPLLPHPAWPLDIASNAQVKEATSFDTDAGITVGQKRKRTQTEAHMEGYRAIEQKFFDALTKNNNEQASAQHHLHSTSQALNPSHQLRAPCPPTVVPSTGKSFPFFDRPKNLSLFGTNPELDVDASGDFFHQPAHSLSGIPGGFQHPYRGWIPWPHLAIGSGLQHRLPVSSAFTSTSSGQIGPAPPQLPYPQVQQYVGPDAQPLAVASPLPAIHQSAIIAFGDPIPQVRRVKFLSSSSPTGSVSDHKMDPHPQSHALPLPLARGEKPEVDQAITAAASAADAAHQLSIPKASRTPYPPPIDSEDVQRSIDRGLPQNPDLCIYLSVIFDQPGHAPLCNIKLSMPVNWDLAFHHCGRIAEFYSNRGGNLPAVTFPIKISLPATGDLLIHWMYKQILLPVPDFPPRLDILEQVYPWPQLLLVDLWICATDLKIPKLQNIAMIEIDRSFATKTHPRTLTHVYKYTETGSLLRKYFVWMYANQVSNHVTLMEDAVKIYPTAFIIEWITLLTQMWLGNSGKNDVKINMTMEDFMVEEFTVNWASPAVEWAVQ